MSKSPVTYIVIALNVLAYAWVVLGMGGDVLGLNPSLLVEVGGITTPYVYGDEPWRLLTGVFLHGGLMHLLMNMYCLYQFRDFESMVGSLAYGVIYMGSALLGGMVTLLTISPNTVSVGASGAVFGIFGAFAAFAILNRRQYPPEHFRRIMGSIATFLGLNLIVGLAVPNIDMGAHLGGFLGGALMMWIIHAFALRRQMRVGILVSGLLSVASVAGLVAAKEPPVTFQHVMQTLQEAESAISHTYEDLATRYRDGKITAAEFQKAINDKFLPIWTTSMATFESYQSSDEREVKMLSILDAYNRGWKKRLEDTNRLLNNNDTGAWVLIEDQNRAELARLIEDLERYLGTLR